MGEEYATKQVSYFLVTPMLFFISLVSIETNYSATALIWVGMQSHASLLEKYVYKKVFHSAKEREHKLQSSFEHHCLG